MPLMREFRADFRRGRTGEGLRARSDTEAYQVSLRDACNMMVLPSGGLRRRWGTYIRATLSAKTRLIEWIGPSVKHNFIVLFQPGQAIFHKIKTVSEANDGNWSDWSETVAGPWTTDTLPFIQITPTRDGFIVTDNSFAPRMFNYDPDQPLTSRWTVKTMTQKSFGGGRRKQIPFVAFNPDITFTPRVFTAKDTPDAYQTHIGTALGYTKGAYPANDFDGTAGTGRIDTDAPYFKAGHVGTRLRMGAGELEVLEVTSSTRAKVEVKRDLGVKLDTNPFLLRKDSRLVQVAWPNHGLKSGELVFFYGMPDSGAATALLVDIPQVVSSASGTSAVSSGTAKTYTVRQVIDDNHFEINQGSGGTLPTSTQSGGGADIVAIAKKGFDEVTEAIMGPARGYPQAACLHENRLWFGGFPEFPDAAIGSVPFSTTNFDTGEGGPADAVLLLGVGNKSQIRHLVSFTDLLIFHDKGVHFVPSPKEAAVSQETARARPGAEFGSSYTTPVLIDGGVFYVEREGKHIREFVRPEDEGIPTSPPVTIVVNDWIKQPFEAQSYVGGGDESMAYSFFVQTDGSLLVMHSSRNDQSFGFMRWELSHENDVFESICAVGDRLWAVVKRSSDRFLVEFDTWSSQPIGMDLVERLTAGVATRDWDTVHHASRSSIQVTKGEAPGRYAFTFVGSEVPANGQFRIPSKATEIRVGRRMEFYAHMHPVVPETTQGNMAGAKIRLVSADIHWRPTDVGTVHGWQVAENPDDLDTEFDVPISVTGWRHYPIGEWGEEAFVKIEGDRPGRMGIRAINMKVYL